VRVSRHTQAEQSRALIGCVAAAISQFPEFQARSLKLAGGGKECGPPRLAGNQGTLAWPPSERSIEGFRLPISSSGSCPKGIFCRAVRKARQGGAPQDGSLGGKQAMATSL